MVEMQALRFFAHCQTEPFVRAFSSVLDDRVWAPHSGTRVYAGMDALLADTRWWRPFPVPPACQALSKY